jgi:hypothetical protein
MRLQPVALSAARCSQWGCNLVVYRFRPELFLTGIANISLVCGVFATLRLWDERALTVNHNYSLGNVGFITNQRRRLHPANGLVKVHDLHLKVQSFRHSFQRIQCQQTAQCAAFSCPVLTSSPDELICAQWNKHTLIKDAGGA